MFRKQPAQAGEVAADTRRMQVPNHAFRNAALRHFSLLRQANAARISPPICSNAVRAYGITAPRRKKMNHTRVASVDTSESARARRSK
jgi:hypothetical protein